MDISRQLQSILRPVPVPANHARPKVPPGSLRDFAATLAQATPGDPAILPFGVSPPVENAAGPAVLPSRPNLDEPVITESEPTIGPGLPEDEPAIAEPPVELQDTLGDLIARTTKASTTPAGNDPLTPPDALDPPTETPLDTPVTEADPPATAEPPVSLLPPIGIEWAPVTLQATNASGHGIDGSAVAIAESLSSKFNQYDDPARFGVTLNLEGRLFRDAVSKGYVANSPEGLGTLLGYLSQGAIGADARPAPMTEYFRQYFAAEGAAN